MAKETVQFKTEVSEILNLVIHSLYTHKEIFLRELISNASDAIDKLRHEQLINKDLKQSQSDLKIKLNFDSEANTITILDNGLGMDKGDLENNLGTIARSGTKEFMKKIKDLQKQKKEAINADLIGQFGVGFYSAFMVADKIIVKTKKANNSQAFLWESTGKESFTIDTCDKEDTGTEITLYLNEEGKEYASEWKIKEVIKKYSDYIAYPIVMDVTREEKPKDKDGKEIEDAEPISHTEEETLNSQKAIWKKDPKDIEEKEYQEFYKHLSHDYQDPIDQIHFKVEGLVNYTSLLYFPSKAPFDLYMKESKIGVSLYVNNVFIMDNCTELLPEYLRFIKGIVDSSDLPLNISRETFQNNSAMQKMKKNLVKKILNALKVMKKKDYNKYVEFYQEMGKVIKEGLHTDYDNQKVIADLLLYKSTKTEDEKLVSFKEYVERMPEEQKDIYYLIGEDQELMKNSPHLEKFNKKGYEVLLFSDSIDEFVMGTFTEYDGKSLKSIGKGEIELEDTEEEKTIKKEKQKEFKSVMEIIKNKLEDDIKEVKISSRLTDSPACLVADESAMSPSMEKLFKSMNQEIPKSKRILEINPDHKIIDIMNKIFQKDKKSTKLAEYAELLYDQALIAEGSLVRDAGKFAKRVSDLIISEGENLI